MTRSVRLREEADRDLAAAASWYERQRKDIGHEILAEALTAFQRLLDDPFRHPVIHRDTRRALMARFPFGIYFALSDRSSWSWRSSTAAAILDVGGVADDVSAETS